MRRVSWFAGVAVAAALVTGGCTSDGTAPAVAAKAMNWRGYASRCPDLSAGAAQSLGLGTSGKAVRPEAELPRYADGASTRSACSYAAADHDALPLLTVQILLYSSSTGEQDATRYLTSERAAAGTLTDARTEDFPGGFIVLPGRYAPAVQTKVRSVNAIIEGQLTMNRSQINSERVVGQELTITPLVSIGGDLESGLS